MVTGAIIFFIGIVVGNFWQRILRRTLLEQDRLIRHLVRKKAQIIDISPPVDLGEDKTEKV